jgi:hypothetical protein
MKPSTVIYIAGYGRSGSTILDMTLGEQPHAFGLSELTHVFDYWAKNRDCSCGQKIQDCSFWKSIFQQAGFDQEFVQKAAKATRVIESRPLWWSQRFRKNECETYKQAWTSIMDLVAIKSNGRFLIDSSKTTRPTIFRAAALEKFCLRSVYVVHLVRNPDAVAWSYLRGDNTKLENGVVKVKTGGKYRVAVSWLLANAWVHLLYARRKNYQLVKYETFASQPNDVIHKILDDLADGATTDQTKGSPAIEFDHGIAGNRTRRSSKKKVVVDREWQSRCSGRSGWVGWPLRKWYGY